MKIKVRLLIAPLAAATVLLVYFGFRTSAGAHCDTMDGPVVRDARRALAAGKVTPVLKWVTEEQEPQIESVFKQALAVRGQSASARTVADQLFFETLVRIHRTSEGEPFTGLKPAGTDPGPAVRLADRALDSANADELVKAIVNKVGNGIRRRFAEAAEKRKHAEHTVSEGREFVASYVEFTHYVDKLYATATGAHGEHEEAGAAQEVHKH